MDATQDHLSLYRRHERTCRFRKSGVRHIKCGCPVWVDGQRLGKRTRRSMKTRSWDQAKQRLEKLDCGSVAELQTSPTVEQAVRAYLQDCQRRKLAESTVRRYDLILLPLIDYFPATKVNHISLQRLTTFQTQRDQNARGSGHLAVIVLRMFLNFCADRGWIAVNPAQKLKSPKYAAAPTMPFSFEEVERLLEACGRISGGGHLTVERNRARAKALLLVMLYTGFRISDTVKLERASVDFHSGQILIRVMKTGNSMYSRLPQHALDALRALPSDSPYFFWSGASKLITGINSAFHTIKKVAKLAAVTNCHPHRFRDTFSVTLLLNGVDIRTVQKLLGHASVATTERHYSPWVSGMQRMLDEAVSVLHFGSGSPKPRLDAQHDGLGDS